MKRIILPFRVLLPVFFTVCLCLLTGQLILAQQLAFPGAEGFGKFATGGRTGSVYHVTNLNDAGAGSLRDAVSASNRIVVFDVAGVIKITGRIVVSANIYIAGQTSPGEGITVYGNGWSFSGAHNSICRYLKIRMGAVGSSGKDANGIADGHDMIFDHCSISWGRDETFSINAPDALRITIQNCIMSQGLLTHSAGGLIQTNGGVTLYRNLYADNGTRNNKVKGVNQYVNNIVYNWSAGAYIMGGDSEGESFANAIGNCFIQGPVDGTRPFSVGNNLYHIYESDNIQDSNRNGIFDPVQIQHSEFGGGPDFQAVPYAYPAVPTMGANTLLANSLPTVGACLPYRDLADYYVVNEVKSLGKKGALIANESVLPFGVPTSWSLWPGTPRLDSDNDGIPNAWETANGLNPNLAADAMIITANGYTNIENYINGINAAYSQDYLRAPLNLKADSATQTKIYFSWFDYTEKELGYIFERKTDGAWVVLDSTGINQNFYALSGLQPEEKDTFRVRAYNAGGNSGYSNELIAKSKPVEVPVMDPASFVPDLTWTGAVNQNWDLATNNWLRNGSPAAFTDSSKILFMEAGSNGQTINLAATVGIKDLLINSSGNYFFNGSGLLAGSGSVNKTGTGKITLNNNNTYTGATVLRNGVLEINKLANGLQPSAIGASANYGFNWVWKGGKINYTGGTTSTDRNAVIDATTEFAVENSAAVVTVTGALTGAGGLVKSGPGKLVLKSANPYEGETVIKGGTIEVIPVSNATLDDDIIDNGRGIGTSNILRLQGGTYRTSGGSTTIYENYPMHIYVADSTVNSFEPYRNANIDCAVSGNGTLNYAIPYLREIVGGDWSEFTGTLIANGVNSTDGSIFMVNNADGMPFSRVVTAGNTKINAYNGGKTYSFGGLSGPAGTTLSCGDKFAGSTVTWVIGGLGTNETFSGTIDNNAYSSGTGTTTLVKEGNGYWRLTAANVYSGTTTVTGGALIVNGAHTGTGKITVTDGALAGKGSLTGDVEIQTARLEPGDSSVGTFTLKAKLTLQGGSIVKIDINKNTALFDKVNVTGLLTYNGTLQLDTIGTLAEGDRFKIFTPLSTVAGTFTQFLPATPGPGLQWKFKPATGELLVVSPGFVEPPSNLSLTAATDVVANSSLVNASWADNSDNEVYFLLERSPDSLNFTDIAHPVANATSYADSNLVPNTKYFYRIKAQGAPNASAYSSIVSVRTPALVVAPAQPGNPSPANNQVDVVLTAGALNLTWTGSNNTVAYAVYFGTAPGALTKVADLPYAATATYQLTNLSDYSTYYWRIDATNATGTTTGVPWVFRTASSIAVSGDYRSAQSGSWALIDTWETFNGTDWVTATVVPSSSSNNATIRNGHTVTIDGTKGIKNLIIEPGAIFKSSGSVRNMRIGGKVLNYGTFGSSSVTAERVNFEGYLPNGTITLGGTSTYYLTNFTVNLLAQTVEVVVDANLNLNGYMRGCYSNATSGTAPVGQDDDNITITINSGRTVTLGSASYLQEGSSPTTNTIVEFGNYTYNINGTLDMKSTGTSCIVAHSTKPGNITINVNGSWLTGNAMRLASTAAAPVAGGLFLNIGTSGSVDAGARATGSTTVTNLVVTNTVTGTWFFNMTGNGVLKNKIAATEILYPIGTNGTYSPAKLINSGTADIIAVGVKNTFDAPVNNPGAVVNKQFTITPATPNAANLSIALGWLPADQAPAFTIGAGVVVGHYGNNAWDETAAVLSGSGTIASPYYAKAAGFTSFSPFIVGNPNSVILPLDLLAFNGSYNGKVVNLSWNTAREINVKNFVVERSNDASNFTTIAQVSARNMAATYAHTDLTPLAGISYYRLKIVDKDASYRYSKILLINTRLLNTVTAFPNPASDFISVTYPIVLQPTLLQVYTANGVLVRSLVLPQGSAQTRLELATLANAQYFITLGHVKGAAISFIKE